MLDPVNFPPLPPLEYWKYKISTGMLSLVKEGVESFPFKNAFIYSGFPPYKNDPTACHIQGKGPIPPGWYDIEAPFDSKTTGHYVMRLTPWKTTDTFGRLDLEFHGDSSIHPGLASHGCIVTPAGGLWIRENVHDSGINSLSVVP